MLPTDPTNPSNPSADHAAMAPFWQMTRAILGGVRSMRAAGRLYLPSFEKEDNVAYDRRRMTARMTNVFRDILDNLSMRPFEKPISLPDEAPDEIDEFAKNVDGRGNNLHVFAHDLFRAALSRGLTGVLIDYTKGAQRARTRAEEKAMGARPYWCHYKAEDIVAVYSDYVDGREVLTEVRLREFRIERTKFLEKSFERIRVFRRTDTGTVEWEVYEKKAPVSNPKANKRTDPDNPEMKTLEATTGGEWTLVEKTQTLPLDEIPFVMIVLGERSDWRVEPPLRDAAYLQIELYEQENELKHIRQATAFPMLAANGVEPAYGKGGEVLPIEYGPKAVLYSLPGGTGRQAGTWQFIEPQGSSLKFLAEEIVRTVNQLRELGRQPLTAQTPNLTVISAATAAEKGRAAIHAWVSMLSNGLGHCLRLTGLWLGVESHVEPMIDQDFDLHPIGDDSFAHIIAMATGEEPLISQDAAIEEAKRRGILRADYDRDEDLKLINRLPDDPSEA